MENKELKAIRQKRWYEKHKMTEKRIEAQRISKAKWYEKHKERERERHRIAYRAKAGPQKYGLPKTEKVKAIKEPKVKEVKLKIEKERKLTQTDVNQRKVTIKAKKEKPIRIPKEKQIVTREDCIIKMTDTRVYPKVRDVRRGWDDTMAKLRAKFENNY